METLLRTDFTAHYNLPVSAMLDIAQRTTASYFEVEDDINKETQLHIAIGAGMAAFRNDSSLEVIIINYDKFVTGLSHKFQQSQKRCDLIVHTNEQGHFLLAELKNKNPREEVRTDSIPQLKVSLNTLMAVPAIRIFVNSHRTRRCCFFNKQAMAPPTINAIAAFNRISQIATNGLNLPEPDIEAYGFQFWEYSGGQPYIL